MQQVGGVAAVKRGVDSEAPNNNALDLSHGGAPRSSESGNLMR